MKPSEIPRLFGVIGCPVGHTLSPYMHNAAFSKIGINAIYLPFDVKPEDLKDFLKNLRSCRIEGLNVTIPLKEVVLKFLDYLSKEAKLIGAVNTIVVEGKSLKGYNTDAQGFLQALKKDLGFRPEGRRACIVGAGGAARAVCFALADAKINELWITDIVFRRAKVVSETVEKNFPKCYITPFKLNRISEVLEGIDLLVNATPVGMKKTDPSIIEPKFLNKDIAVYDLVYNIETRLVKAAKAKGLVAANGLGMLLYQGALSFELWIGRQAPIDTMRSALKKAIKVKLQ